MLFNSFSFIGFFITVSLAYYLLPHKWRWLLLFLASCYFYMAFVPEYLLILFATIVVNYLAGYFLEKRTDPLHRKRILWLAIFLNLALLGFFKYFNFFADNINTIAQALNWNYSIAFLQIILPIGLSFHTFQALSYVIEIYRNKQKSVSHFGIYALYVMYYPQLVAGPIERPQNLLHQFEKEQVFKSEDVVYGLKRMAWGFFKKTVVADTLAIIVTIVYANPSGYDGPTLIFATICFAFQLYCDFSGYSDIAVGSSRVMGIRLMENFERPYFSKSVAEFWRRWHISLSSWLRDYVYYPMALSLKNPTRYKLYCVTIITFLLSGLWHGAAWTYVIMGAIFGTFIVFSEMTKSLKSSIFSKSVWSTVLLKYLNVITTFVLVCFGWIFFRANSLQDAIYITTHLFTNTFDFISSSYNYYTWKNLLSLNGLVLKETVVVACVGVLAVLFYDLIERKESFWSWLSKYPVYIRFGVYYLIVFSILAYGRFGAEQFIYFQF